MIEYAPLALPLLVLALLMIAQLLTADVAGIVAKHTPGTRVPEGH